PGKLWDESDVVYLLEEILKILKFVHKNNIIHRDIKPANIMRRHKDNKIVLIDFGGVKQVKAQTDSTMLTPVVGTHGYMPDEQFRNNAQLCSDIYAVGMLGIQALTGIEPKQLLRDAKTGQQLWQDKAKVSEGLANVIDKMVRFHYKERYQSADEALESVKNLLLRASYWFERGDQLLQSKVYKQGIKAYNEAIKIKPDYHQAWYSRGIALRKLKRYDEAIDSYDQAIKIKPDYYHAWYGRAWVLDELDKYDEAISSYNRAIQIKPNCHYALFNRGIALHSLEKYEEAISSFDKAIENKRDLPQAWYHRGIALYELENYKEALKSFDEALSIQPDYELARENRDLAEKKLQKPFFMKWLGK
ncbi:MAG: tetratricopeptide repeat protein, partial [Rivularia sp. (in: cyanobacteria)]